MSATRLDRRDPRRPPVRVGDDPDETAVVTVSSGVPPVTSTGPVVDAVGGDQGAVEQQVPGPLVHRRGDHLGQAGRPGGEHIEGFVQVAVSGLEADGVVTGRVSDRGASTHAPREQNRLGEATRRWPEQRCGRRRGWQVPCALARRIARPGGAAVPRAVVRDAGSGLPVMAVTYGIGRFGGTGGDRRNRGGARFLPERRERCPGA